MPTELILPFYLAESSLTQWHKINTLEALTLFYLYVTLQKGHSSSGGTHSGQVFTSVVVEDTKTVPGGVSFASSCVVTHVLLLLIYCA